MSEKTTPCGAGRCVGDYVCGHHALQAGNAHRWLDAVDALPPMSRRERAAWTAFIDAALNAPAVRPPEETP